MTTPAIETPTIDGSKLNERTICLVVRRGKLGISKQAKAIHVTGQMPMTMPADSVITDADPRMVRVAKQLLDCPELKAITGLDFEVRDYLTNRCLPSMFRRGIWLLPVDLLDDVDAHLNAFAEKRRELIEVFLAVYQQRADEAAARLGSLYNALDYPSVEQARRAFFFDWQYTSFDVPGRLKNLRKDLFDREKAKMAARLNAVAEEIQQGLRVAFGDLVSNLASALKPAADGKKKKFHGSHIDKLVQFLELFQARNITDDDALKALVAQSRDLISGVTPDWLRSDEDMREVMADAFTELQQQLAPLVVTAPKRVFDFAGEEDAA